MSRRERFLSLRAEAPAILPSLLMCDFGDLRTEVARLEEAGAPALHLDVMDGHFVPNLSYGLPVVETFRRLTELPLDVHLMISNPELYIERYVEAGADCVTIHAEAVADPRPVLESIRRLGVASGLSINPATPVDVVLPVLDACDLVLVMSVSPGFGGQAFDRTALDKTRRLAGSDVLLEIDGGVNAETIGDCAAAGSQLMVVGSAIFKKSDYGAAIRELRELAQAQHAS